MLTITKNSHSHSHEAQNELVWNNRATWFTSNTIRISGGMRGASRRPALKIHEEDNGKSQEHNIDLLYVPIGVRLTTEVRRSREHVTPGVTLEAACYGIRDTYRASCTAQHLLASRAMDQSEDGYRAFSSRAFVFQRSGGNHLWPAVQSRKRRISDSDCRELRERFD